VPVFDCQKALAFAKSIQSNSTMSTFGNRSR